MTLAEQGYVPLYTDISNINTAAIVQVCHQNVAAGSLDGDFACHKLLRGALLLVSHRLTSTCMRYMLTQHKVCL